MTRQDIFEWCKQQYDVEPDYPWNDWNAVLRHKDNRKWFGLVLEVKGNKLGMDTEKMVDLLNIKCDPMLIGSLLLQRGFFPAYHMNKDNWISILLDDPENDEKIKSLLDMSYEMTKNRKKKRGSKEA